MSRRGLLWSVVGLLASGGLATVSALALSAAAPGHTPLHIGCRHHNHGAKWHADHGRILGATRGERVRVRQPDAEELTRRSLTFGRRGSRLASRADD